MNLVTIATASLTLSYKFPRLWTERILQPVLNTIIKNMPGFTYSTGILLRLPRLSRALASSGNSGQFFLIILSDWLAWLKRTFAAMTHLANSLVEKFRPQVLLHQAITRNKWIGTLVINIHQLYDKNREKSVDFKLDQRAASCYCL